MVAAEAMMMEKVCIISDNCGISDYIEDGKNGLISIIPRFFVTLFSNMQFCAGTFRLTAAQMCTKGIAHTELIYYLSTYYSIEFQLHPVFFP